MKIPTEAELIELENSIGYWDSWRRDQIQLLIDFARAHNPPIPPMPPRHFPRIADSKPVPSLQPKLKKKR